MAKKQICSIGFLFAAIVLAAVSFVSLKMLIGTSLLCFAGLFFISIISSCICFAASVIFSQTLWIIGIGVIASFVGSWVVSDSASLAVLFLISFVPVGAALGFCYRNKKLFNDTVMAAAVNATVLGLIAFGVLIGELSGGSFDVKEALGPVSENFRNWLVEIFSADSVSMNPVFQIMGISSKAFAFQLYSYIISNIPTFYMSIILLVTVLSFWIMKSIVKRTKTQVSFMGRFCDCKISFVCSVFYVVCNLCYILFYNYDFAIAFMNYSNILKFVFVYAGISLIAYFLELKNFGTVGKNIILVIVIFICLTSSSLAGLVSLLGLFDSGMNFRNRLENSGV